MAQGPGDKWWQEYKADTNERADLRRLRPDKRTGDQMVVDGLRELQGHARSQREVELARADLAALRAELAAAKDALATACELGSPREQDAAELRALRAENKRLRESLTSERVLVDELSTVREAATALTDVLAKLVWRWRTGDPITAITPAELEPERGKLQALLANRCPTEDPTDADR